jgi:predicted nucleotide-binding protein
MSSQMIQRYTGETGRRRLIDALRAHPVFEGDEGIAREIAQVAELRECAEGDPIITQGGCDNGIAFIVSGAVSILINGREVNQRRAGQHVGEMALIDPSARRSASVIATTGTVVAWVSESEFSAIAEHHPRLWRKLAVELGERLRQRGDLVPEKNTCPHLFIGSSTETLPVALGLKNGFVDPQFLIHLWSDGIFQASKTAIENLEKEMAKCDFAVLVAGPDDWVYSKERERLAPRDNVIFELGLFMVR